MTSHPPPHHLINLATPPSATNAWRDCVDSYERERRVFLCSAGCVQTSVKAGTIFHRAKTPLTKWFIAMHLLTSAKNDISGLTLVWIPRMQ
ncbi:MAG: hypothetical protein KDJ36_04985 [Hyphomicrobiaceae bacterium]|nr:hypothetical protein [Hyphomicrobiaceae bacterium]